MHDASSGLGLISLDLAGVCVVCTACDAVRGGPAVVLFVRNGSQAGPMTVGGYENEENQVPSCVVLCCVCSTVRVCVCVCSAPPPGSTCGRVTQRVSSGTDAAAILLVV